MGGMDEATRTHIRNLDVYMQRLLEEVGQGRQQSTQEIRSEIKLLARTIAALAEESDVRRAMSARRRHDRARAPPAARRRTSGRGSSTPSPRW